MSPSVFGAGLAADDLILTLYFTLIYSLAKAIPPDAPVDPTHMTRSESHLRSTSVASSGEAMKTDQTVITNGSKGGTKGHGDRPDSSINVGVMAERNRQRSCLKYFCFLFDAGPLRIDLLGHLCRHLPCCLYYSQSWWDPWPVHHGHHRVVHHGGDSLSERDGVLVNLSTRPGKDTDVSSRGEGQMERGVRTTSDIPNMCHDDQPTDEFPRCLQIKSRLQFVKQLEASDLRPSTLPLQAIVLCDHRRLC